MINIGRVQKLLQERKLTYAELSNITGLNTAVLHRYCTGSIKSIPAERLVILARALGTTPDYLMGADDDEPKNEREKQIIAAYNSLSDDNRQLIEDLLDRLLRSQK